MDQFEQKEMTKKRPFSKKQTWYNQHDWLTGYIPESIKKDEIMNISKTNMTKVYNKPTRVNNVYAGGGKPRKPNIKNKQKTK